MENIKVLYSEEQIQAKVKEMAEQINKDFKGEELCVICVLKGSAPFCTDLIKRINLPLTLEFIRVSTYEGDSSTGKVNHLDMTLPIRKVIRSVTESFNGCFVSSDGLTSNDQVTANADIIHFSRESQYILGKRYFDAYKKILKNDLLDI